MSDKVLINDQCGQCGKQRNLREYRVYGSNCVDSWTTTGTDNQGNRTETEHSVWETNLTPICEQFCLGCVRKYRLKILGIGILQLFSGTGLLGIILIDQIPNDFWYVKAGGFLLVIYLGFRGLGNLITSIFSLAQTIGDLLVIQRKIKSTSYDAMLTSRQVEPTLAKKIINVLTILVQLAIIAFIISLFFNG